MLINKRNIILMGALLLSFDAAMAGSDERPVVPDTKASAAAKGNAGGEKDDDLEGAKTGEKGKEDSAQTKSFGNYLAGRFAETAGDTQNGLKYVEEAARRDPSNIKNLSSLYRMYVLSGKLENAPAVATKLLGTKVVDDGSEFSPEMFMVLHSAKQGDFPKAEQYLKKLPKEGFNNLLSPLLMAWVKLGQGEIKAPLEPKSLISDPKLLLPHVYLTFAYVNELAGFDDKAAEYFDKAVADERSKTLRTVQAAAGFYIRHGDKDKYTKLVDDYFKTHGESYLANALLKHAAGTPPAKLVMDVRQGVAEAFYTVASIFHGARASADEIASLNLTLYVRPDFPEAQFLLATAHELSEDYTAAIRVYAGIDKNSPYFLRGRIRSLYDESETGSEHTEEPLAKLSDIAKEMPEDIDALLARGDILRMRSRYAEAVENYTSAITRLKTLEKNHWVVFFSRGACFERMGKMDEAEADMKKALSLSPKEPDVLNYLGYTWLSKQRNVAEARKMIETAYEARPEDAHIIDSMGYALYLSGDYSSAQEYFQQALERTPDDPTVNDHLGDTYWQLGRKTEAKYQWNRALSAEKDAAQKQILEQKIDKGITLKPSVSASEEKKTVIDLPADE